MALVTGIPFGLVFLFTVLSPGAEKAIRTSPDPNGAEICGVVLLGGILLALWKIVFLLTEIRDRR